MNEHELKGITVDVTKFFATMGKCAAITDAETDELLYLNQKAMETFKIKSLDEVKGRKCYEIFNGFSAPCSFCMHSQAKIDEFRDWAYYNAKLERYCLLHDTLFNYEGRLLHFEMLSDIDNQHWLRQVIHQITFNDRIVNEAVGLALSEANPDRAIDIFLKHVGENLNVSRCYIFEKTKENTFKNTYEWCRPGEIPQINDLQNVPWENVIELWYDEFDKRRNIVITDIEAYKKIYPNIYDLLKLQGIKTFIVAPISVGNKRIGFYGAENPPIESLRNVKSLYEILGDFIAAMLRHRDNMRELELCSTMDQLTGVANRHALSMYFNDAEKSQSIGLIFCDINSLKKMNDEYGHAAGDALIKRAVNALRTLFTSHRIFRMGGDEFLCIRRGDTAENLDKDVEKIREACKANDVSMAVGAIWMPDDNTDFDSLLKMVDSKMYLDKRNFYGDRRRSTDRKDISVATLQ